MRYDTVLQGDVPKAPGMKYKHYSPKAKVQIVSKDMSFDALKALIQEYGAQGRRVFLIEEENSEMLAKEIFKKFRMADELGYDLILVREIGGNDMSDAVMNRIGKAASEEWLGLESKSRQQEADRVTR